MGRILTLLEIIFPSSTAVIILGARKHQTNLCTGELHFLDTKGKRELPPRI